MVRAEVVADLLVVTGLLVVFWGSAAWREVVVAFAVVRCAEVLLVFAVVVFAAVVAAADVL